MKHPEEFFSDMLMIRSDQNFVTRMKDILRDKFEMKDLGSSRHGPRDQDIEEIKWYGSNSNALC